MRSCPWLRWCCRPGCRVSRGQYAWFDLPLVVTVYFALGRRSPIQGTLMGGAVGLFEDALTHHAIGINGIAKTVVGFLAASVGIRIDVENRTIRLALIFLALPAFQRDLHLCVPLSARACPGVKLARRVAHSHWQLGHRAGCSFPSSIDSRYETELPIGNAHVTGSE